MQIKRVWSLGEDAADAVQLLAIEHDDVGDDDDDADQTPTVRLLDALLGDAVRDGASDIHVEPQRDGVRIRYRVDGLLRDMMTVPRSAGPSMISRLKIISGARHRRATGAPGRPHPDQRRRPRRSTPGSAPCLPSTARRS